MQIKELQDRIGKIDLYHYKKIKISRDDFQIFYV